MQGATCSKLFQQNRPTVHAQRCTVYLHKSSVRLIVPPLSRLYRVYIHDRIHLYTYVQNHIRMRTHKHTHTQGRKWSQPCKRTPTWFSSPGFSYPSSEGRGAGGIVLFLIKRTGGHEIALSFFTAAALHESKLMIKTLSCSKPSLTQDRYHTRWGGRGDRWAYILYPWLCFCIYTGGLYCSCRSGWFCTEARVAGPKYGSSVFSATGCDGCCSLLPRFFFFAPPVV